MMKVRVKVRESVRVDNIFIIMIYKRQNMKHMNQILYISIIMVNINVILNYTIIVRNYMIKLTY